MSASKVKVALEVLRNPALQKLPNAPPMGVKRVGPDKLEMRCRIFTGNSRINPLHHSLTLLEPPNITDRPMLPHFIASFDERSIADWIRDDFDSAIRESIKSFHLASQMSARAQQRIGCCNAILLEPFCC